MSQVDIRDRVENAVSWVRTPHGRPRPRIDQEAFEFFSKRGNAETQIKLKWNSLGGIPGAPKIPGKGGLIEVCGGFYHEYAHGRIYYQPDLGAFHVYGAIGNRYAYLGGPCSWLGWPTSDEQPFAQDGRVSTFQHGAIYWWPDTGAIELGNISVRYTGLACFSETDWDQGSPDDEPYVIFAVVPALTGQTYSPRTQVYGNFDSGEAVGDNIELYRGLPYGLSLSAVLMESDFGNPDKYRETINKGVEKASEAVATGIGYVPYVGPFLAKAAEALLDAIGPGIAKGINDLLGFGDDHINTVSLVVTAKDMVRLTRVDRGNFRGILWHLDSPLISGDGADYKVYLDIQAI